MGEAETDGPASPSRCPITVGACPLNEMTSNTFRLSGLHMVAALAGAGGYVHIMEGTTAWATIISSN